MAGSSKTEVRLDAATYDVAPNAAPRSHAPVTLFLDDRRALDAAVVGAKSAALARAKERGLPVLPGFAVTTDATPKVLVSGRVPDDVAAELHSAWTEVSRAGKRRIVVRSSSVAEDGSGSSMAGMFTSVTDVTTWESFLDAVAEVVGSSRRAGGGPPAPIGVLVQPFVDADVGGVMFGVDPLTGGSDRLVVAAIDGTPEALVSGEVEGSRYVLSRNGRIIEGDFGSHGATLGGRRRRALAGLAAHAERAFGGPQDVEWAIDLYGRLWLLQSRPVTAAGRSVSAAGPLLGPGPVAETFPEQLSLLEEEMWLDPLRDALRHALSLVKSASKRRIARSPIVVTVHGRAAADLELLGAAPGRRSLLRRLDPRPPLRRLSAGWNVGRLRAAMPTLASRLVEQVDEELSRLGPLSEYTDGRLVDLLRRSRQTLVALYGHEVLAGMLMQGETVGPTSSWLGLRALARGRAAGLNDAALVAAHPEVLALVVPAIGKRLELPAAAPALTERRDTFEPLAEQRERCRLRARWIQELGARSAHELGLRAARRGLLQDAADVKLLRVDEIERVFEDGRFPEILDTRIARPASAPLPTTFRLADDGTPVAVSSGARGHGTGAGGGRGKGNVTLDPTSAGAGSVLVVSTLDPDLASVLPGLAGIVAETGSVLSHLAILAREFGVPAVVGYPGATNRFTEGTSIVVDGTSGEVVEVEATS